MTNEAEQFKIDHKKSIRKIVTRAMQDVRGLDEQFPNEEDAEELASILNGILDIAVDQILNKLNEIRSRNSR